MRQAGRTTILKMLMSIFKWNAQISTLHSEILSRSKVELSNVSVALVIARYLCPSDNTFSAANIRCSATLTGITGLSLARTAPFLTTNVHSSHLEALCTLKTMLHSSTAFTCLINVDCYLSKQLASSFPPRIHSLCSQFARPYPLLNICSGDCLWLTILSKLPGFVATNAS